MAEFIPSKEAIADKFYQAYTYIIEVLVKNKEHNDFNLWRSYLTELNGLQFDFENDPTRENLNNLIDWVEENIPIKNFNQFRI
jgi:hypothetical protein